MSYWQLVYFRPGLREYADISTFEQNIERGVPTCYSAKQGNAGLIPGNWVIPSIKETPANLLLSKADALLNVLGFLDHDFGEEADDEPN